MFGISVFPGMEIDIEENLEYIRSAVREGAEYIFTSLHIPEADEGKISCEFELILRESRANNLTTIVDISKGYYDRYRWDKMGDIILRLDFGFSLEEAAALSRLHRIQLNASTIDRDTYYKLREAGADLERITVCHNYYPRPETGISLELLRKRNSFFRELGLRTMGFVCGNKVRRGPICEGLPTVEEHRNAHIITASQELLLEGCDVVLIGDSMACDEEIRALKEVIAAGRDGIDLLIPVKLRRLSHEEEWIMEMVHEERMDPAHYVIRSSNSRMAAGREIPANNCIERRRGSITVDNSGYGRYQGEVQISRRNLPADSRVNVIGEAAEGGRLVERIRGGDKFKFKKTEEHS